MSGREGRVALVATLLLSGCASYLPQPIEITDNAKYSADVQMCMTAAANYKPQFDFGNIGASIVNGAADHASTAVINPLAPAVGAAAGLASSTATDLNVMGQARKNVAKHCILEKTRRDQSAIVADPDN
jgi:hypothetical protein